MYTLTRPITNCCAALTGLLCYAAMQQVQYSVYKVLLAQLQFAQTANQKAQKMKNKTSFTRCEKYLKNALTLMVVCGVDFDRT